MHIRPTLSVAKRPNVLWRHRKPFFRCRYILYKHKNQWTTSVVGETEAVATVGGRTLWRRRVLSCCCSVSDEWLMVILARLPSHSSQSRSSDQTVTRHRHLLPGSPRWSMYKHQHTTITTSY